MASDFSEKLRLALPEYFSSKAWYFRCQLVKHRAKLCQTCCQAEKQAWCRLFDPVVIPNAPTRTDTIKLTRERPSRRALPDGVLVAPRVLGKNTVSNSANAKETLVTKVKESRDLLC